MEKNRDKTMSIIYSFENIFDRIFTSILIAKYIF